MSINKMEITKKHIALCKCHNKKLRCNSKESIDIILSNNIICECCNTLLEYKGEYELDGDIIVDKLFNEQKIEISDTKVKTPKNEKQKFTFEQAIKDKIITEDGMPYKKNDKTPSNNSIITSIKFAIKDENVSLLNSIFIEYNDIIIQDNITKYIGKKQKQYIKDKLNIEI